jgi:hypothetical protein
MTLDASIMIVIFYNIGHRDSVTKDDEVAS